MDLSTLMQNFITMYFPTYMVNKSNHLIDNYVFIV